DDCGGVDLGVHEANHLKEHDQPVVRSELLVVGASFPAGHFSSSNVDESGFLVVVTDRLVAGGAVETQVSLAFRSGLGLSPLEHSKSEAFSTVGALDGELVDIPAVWWEIAPELIIAPLKSDGPNGPLNVLHAVSLATLNIVLDGFAESRARPPPSLKPLRG